jgi:hypothetical protein
MTGLVAALRILSVVSALIGVVALLSYGGWRTEQHPLVQQKLLAAIALFLFAIYALIAAGQMQKEIEESTR